MYKALTPTLFRSLTVFLTVLMISAVVVLASSFYMDDAYQDNQLAKSEMIKWQSKINNSVTNNQIIEKFETNFLSLVNQGVVGAEDRLSWFETLQHAAKKRSMPLVKYSISSQEALKEKNLSREYAGINVYKSVMTLDITMAHEGDLFSLLNDLEKADGLYTVDKCNIEKIGNNSMGTNNMKAFCELGWYTFRGTNVDKSNANKSGVDRANINKANGLKVTMRKSKS